MVRWQIAKSRLLFILLPFKVNISERLESRNKLSNNNYTITQLNSSPGQQQPFCVSTTLLLFFFNKSTCKWLVCSPVFPLHRYKLAAVKFCISNTGGHCSATLRAWRERRGCCQTAVSPPQQTDWVTCVVTCEWTCEQITGHCWSKRSGGQQV